MGFYDVLGAAAGLFRKLGFNSQLLRRKCEAGYWRARVKKTSRDTSSDLIPKVPDAGQVKQFNGTNVQIMHNGVRVFAGGYHGQPMMEIIRNLKGHHEPQEERVFYEILRNVRSNGTMIEVGSFWAYYSLWFSHNMPDRRNYLIEPVLWKAGLGRLNFALNNKDVTVDPYYIHDDTTDVSESAGADRDALVGAEPIRLDEYVRLKGIKRIDILHADIQGAELALLRGAHFLLKSESIDYVFVSTHQERHGFCRELLCEYGYKIINEHSVKNGSGYDGLIVAASPSAAMNLTA